jgi:hypothetical protein
MIDDLTNPQRAGLVVNEMVTPNGPPCACYCDCWCSCLWLIQDVNWVYNNNGWYNSDQALTPGYNS